jgi:putative transcriptional regulator
VNAIETGKHDPSLLLAFRIAQVFGARLEDIFDPRLKPSDGDMP